MGRTMLDWLVSAVRRGLKADFTRQALWAATCGAAALIVCQQALWTVGGAASAHSATYLAILVGILGGMTVPVRGNRLVQLGVALVVFLVGAAWLPWLWDAALSLPGLSSIESSLWNSVATFLVAIPLVALPTALAVALLRSISRGEGTLAGVALGIAASLVAAS